MILYCKNNQVYNIDTEEVYNRYILPGYMQRNPCSKTFKEWFKLRYSSNTNTIARQLKGVTFGNGNRVTINKTTHALSLSDCYWVKENYETLSFEQISPYYNDFWTGKGFYNGGSIPTLYVGGFLNKEWVSSEILQKYGKETRIEYEAYKVCKFAKVPVNEITLIKNGIAIKNITNTEFMLEQADESGRLDPDDFDENTIIKLFGISGVQMIIIDAILGNGDRHAGNFGWLRNTGTGEYVTMAPLYDFDHALDSKLEKDRLTDDAVLSICNTNNKDYIKEAIRICEAVINSDTLDIFKTRAKSIKSAFKEQLIK